MTSFRSHFAVWHWVWAGILILAIASLIAFIWKPPADSVAGDRGVWTCSMHPQIRRSGPGQCPICGMNLIPVSQLGNEESRLESAGLATSLVQRRRLFKELRTVGKFDYSETQVAYIAARIDGRVERVFADVVGTDVQKEDHLVEIYSPTLNVDQSTLVQSHQDVERSRDPMARRNLESARERLRLLGITEKQITEIEETRKTSNYLTIYAPIGGTITEKSVRPGQYVSRGDMLYRIASLDPIWLFLDIYESDLGWVLHGQRAAVELEAYPGEIFEGTVSFIDPFLNDETRTVKVRVTLNNADRRIKPSMYASATIKAYLQTDGRPEPTGLEGKYICPMHPDVIKDEAGRCPICQMELIQVPPSRGVRTMPGSARPHGAVNHGDEHAEHRRPTDVSAEKSEQVDASQSSDNDGVLSVPVSAVLDTGRRQIVYRRNESNGFELVEVHLGPRAAAETEGGTELFFPVLHGLEDGDKVVSRGAFLLDSQRQIEGAPSLLYSEGRSAAGLHSGHAMPASGK